MSEQSHLPVPHICDNEFPELQTKEHSKNDDSFRNIAIKRPPKLIKPRNHDSFLNRSSNSLHALSISFKDSSNITQEVHSSFYDKKKDESYFEQCFEIISTLGEGSFGQVFKVKSKEDGLLYAVKKSKEFFRSEHYRQERLEEVKRYEQFSNHENCVKLYHAWEQDDRLYMQLELCHGSLEDYLREVPTISEERIWSILLDLLLAVKSLHDKNLIHLDIKMDNILIADDGTCKLADFGLVVDADRAKIAAIEGDSRYMAPELMQGQFTQAADIFSLGITILELACNLVLPSNGPLWLQLRNGQFPEHIQKLSDELKSVIKLMMNPNHTQRPTVDDLLKNNKIVSLLELRRRWQFVRTMKLQLRESKRVVNSKLCNFKNLFFYFFTLISTYFKSFVKQKSQINTPQSSTPSSGNSAFSENFEVSSLHGSPIPGHGTNFSSELSNIINSTPLYSLNVRARKDLTKTCFQNEHSTPYNHNEFNSSVRSSFDKTSLRCKKLFSKFDDSD